MNVHSTLSTAIDVAGLLGSGWSISALLQEEHWLSDHINVEQQCEAFKEKSPFFWSRLEKLHQREMSGKMPLKLLFNFSLFIIIILHFIFYITMLYVAQYNETKVMFNLQSFIYSMYWK